MGKYCSDCTYLNPDKYKNNNKGYCKCEKANKFILANQVACDKFCNAYARKNYEKELLYLEAKESENKNVSSPIPSLIILIIILVLKFITG